MKQINYDESICPICKKPLELITEDYNRICKCGFVAITNYPYTAGVRINTELERIEYEKK